MIASKVHYSIDIIKDEARQLIHKGIVSRQQPIYALCEYIRPGEWICIECELEKCGFLFRDRICDLVGYEKWNND